MNSRTYLLNAFKRYLSGQSNGKEVLVRIDKRVSDRDECRIVDGQRKGGNCFDTTHETIDELRFINIKDIRRERVALVVDLHYGHAIRERRDVQHVQECSLGSPDTGACCNNLDIGDDFNRTTRDLGRDTECLEEGSLSGLHSSVACGDNDILRRERTRASWGSNLVGNDDVSDLFEVLGGEDESDVALDMREKPFELGEL